MISCRAAGKISVGKAFSRCFTQYVRCKVHWCHVNLGYTLGFDSSFGKVTSPPHSTLFTTTTLLPYLY